MTGKKSNQDPTKTVLMITLGFLIVYLITKWEWAVFIATTIGLLGLISDYLEKKINFVWLKITWILSLIIPNIILFAVYFFILTPIAFLSKIFGAKNQLQLKDTAHSMFVEKNKIFTKKSFEKPW